MFSPCQDARENGNAKRGDGYHHIIIGLSAALPYHVLAAIVGDEMGSVMGSAKQRPANVPEENVYSRMHWMVIVTYVAAIGAIAMLMIGGG